MRVPPREEEEKIFARTSALYRISRLRHEVFIKSSPDPKAKSDLRFDSSRVIEQRRQIHF